jgi:hypothetical protein
MLVFLMYSGTVVKLLCDSNIGNWLVSEMLVGHRVLWAQMLIRAHPMGKRRVCTAATRQRLHSKSHFRQWRPSSCTCAATP